MRDEVFSKKSSQIVDFAFTEEVAQVFPDMIRRSVPGYETVIPMTGLIAARHLDEATDAPLALDLGCSLGATTQAVLAQTSNAQAQVVGIDNSPPMIEGAQAANHDQRATFICGDIQDPAILDAQRPADVILLNFVLQFFEPSQRDACLNRLHAHLKPGGMLLLSEKVFNSDRKLHDFYDTTHLAWKKANGYSDLEISQKRTALENVMRVDTEEVHQKRLQATGFNHVHQWYRCMNWASFVAFK